MVKTISLEESKKQEKNYEYYTKFENLEKEILISIEDEKMGLKIYNIDQNRLKDIYSILKEIKKMFKYAGQSEKVKKISDTLCFLKKVRRIKETSLVMCSLKYKNNKNFKSYTIDNYSGIIPNVIVKSFYNNCFKYENFGIIVYKNTGYLIGRIFSCTWPIYQLSIILDNWDIEEESYYKPDLITSISLRIRKFFYNTKEFIYQFIEYC